MPIHRRRDRARLFRDRVFSFRDRAFPFRDRESPLHGRARFLLATLGGCLCFLACAPFDASWLAWISMIPVLWAIDRAPTTRGALALGWWAGAVETAGGFHWLIDVMHRFAGFPWIVGSAVFAVFCAARGLIFLLFAALVRGLRGARAARRRSHPSQGHDSLPHHRAPLPLCLIAPPAMVAGELLVPQIFPAGQWISQAWHPWVIQIAEFTGPWGVTALLLMINGALADLLLRGRRAAVPAIAAALLIAAALIFGWQRMRTIDAVIASAPRLSIGLVQPNFAYSADGIFSRDEAVRQLDALQTQSQRLERAGAELIIWSEGSYPVALPRNFAADFSSHSPARIRRDIGAPVIIGTSTYESEEGDAYNSALLINRDGRVGGRYDKVRLLAFGEYMPGIEHFPWLRNLMPDGAGRFKPGSGPGVIPFKDARGLAWTLGTVICYEDLLPGFLRGVGELRPNLLVNLTSDSWFGAFSEPWEHLALSVFASVELRVSLVRAVNSGVSSLIEPDGRVAAVSYADDPYVNPRPADGMVVSAPRMTGAPTFYVRHGFWFPVACGLLLVLLSAVRWRRVRRRSAESAAGAP